MGRWLAALGSVFLLCAGPAQAAPELTEAAGCGECHSEATLPGLPHGELGCTACHTDVDPLTHLEEPPAPRPEEEICAQCHGAAQELAGSVHEGLGCGDCHGPAHEILPVSDFASALSPVRQLQTCGGCHQTPPELMDGFLSSVHGRALLLSGLVAAPSCNDCHGAHAILPPSDARSSVSHQNVPETCGSCHALLLDTWREGSAHGLAWQAKDPGGPVCVTCHTSHAVQDPTDAAERFRFPEDCGSCHSGPYSSYRDGFHGQVTDLGFVSAAICSDCHTPHQNVPADNPDSSVHPTNLVATCGQCHGAVSASFVSFDPHVDARHPTRRPVIHYTWLFMTGLLIAVFGFFAIHDSLWLQRSLVGVLRGEFATSRQPTGPYVRRFTRLQVWLHVVVIVTFLTLAATGLPLKFHFTPWARDLASVFGGVGSAARLHRLAALVTFGYMLCHLGHLFIRIVLRKEPGLLWGWNSMVPRAKDFRDLYQHLRYFLYLGPRPRFDRWTYWEKFDYFAVFWGVMIIGVSGLMLWFHDLATRLVPGWTLNVAFVVHSDEALLAVGFIFIFHFFHAHLRPESFPWDPVVFVDRVPLERFKEERPVEYERLRASGELESYLVSAPTPSQFRSWRIFAFGALLVGMLLAIAILWSVFVYGPPF